LGVAWKELETGRGKLPGRG